MPPDRLAQAEQVVARILLKAGVQVVWLGCTVATGQWQPACDRPLGPTDFMLDFVEEIQSLTPKVGETTLSFAMVTDDGGLTIRAYISNRRVHEMASRRQASPAMILGLAAAHEIGHLLMNSGDHSRSGLMRTQWGPRDLERAERGDLLFTDDQVKQIRVGVLARIAQYNLPQVEATVRRRERGKNPRANNRGSSK